MLVARLALGFLLLAGAAVAAVALGIDRWTLNTADATFFMTGLRRTCTVNGCTDNDYTSTNLVVGNCSVATSTFESLNDAAWGVQLAGIGTLGVGAVIMVISSVCHGSLAAFVAPLAAAILGLVAYVVGGGLAYHTHNEWLYCGVTFCDNYYAAGGLRCLSQQGPSFALWCIAIAVGVSGACGGVWLVASDVAKKKVMKTPLRRNERQTSTSALRQQRSSVGASSPARVNQNARPMSPREPSASAQVRPTAPTTSIVVPAGFVYQPEAAMYYSEEQKTFFDQRNGHYFSPQHSAWYNPESKSWYVKEEHTLPANNAA